MRRALIALLVAAGVGCGASSPSPPERHRYDLVLGKDECERSRELTAYFWARDSGQRRAITALYLSLDDRRLDAWVADLAARQREAHRRVCTGALPHDPAQYVHSDSDAYLATMLDWMRATGGELDLVLACPAPDCPVRHAGIRADPIVAAAIRATDLRLIDLPVQRRIAIAPVDADARGLGTAWATWSRDLAPDERARPADDPRADPLRWLGTHIP